MRLSYGQIPLTWWARMTCVYGYGEFHACVFFVCDGKPNSVALYLWAGVCKSLFLIVLSPGQYRGGVTTTCSGAHCPSRWECLMKAIHKHDLIEQAEVKTQDTGVWMHT